MFFMGKNLSQSIWNENLKQKQKTFLEHIANENQHTHTHTTQHTNLKCEMQMNIHWWIDV